LGPTRPPAGKKYHLRYALCVFLRLNEIRVLKIKVNDLKRELHIIKSSVANIDVLKREVHHLSRELLQERTKVKALSEELENPLNVHRCA
jgi:predicted RNase H-like nuclease (RuvC/YqgF family)